MNLDKDYSEYSVVYKIEELIVIDHFIVCGMKRFRAATLDLNNHLVWFSRIR